jgi:hypothetical protein
MNYMWLYVIMIPINHVVNKMGRKVFNDKWSNSDGYCINKLETMNYIY